MRDPYSYSYSYSSRKSKSTFVDVREAEREEILRRLKKKKKKKKRDDEEEEEEEARYLKTREEVRREGQDALLHRAERSRAGGATTDLDELKKHHRFLREEEEEEEKKKGGRGRKNEEEGAMLLNEGERVAMKYEEKLFKEYAIPDLSRCDEGVGLRWRTEKEVARGKGVDICGEKSCSERKNLGTFELNFRYKERGEVKNALVKVVVCPVCEEKLHRSRRKKKKGR